MKILIVAKGDWSGAGYALAKAINHTTEHEARAISFWKYYTDYDSDITNPSSDEIVKWCNWADVINLHDDAENIIPMNIDDKPIIETYHGSWYRNDPDKANLLASNKNRLQTCLTPGLAQYGPLWIGRPIEDMSEMHNPVKTKFVIVHSPTKRSIKGTERIIEELDGLEGIELRVIENVSNKECLREKSKANLFVDMVQPCIGGYGTNTLEAWALGIPSICEPNEHIKDLIVKNTQDEMPFASPSEFVSLRDLVLRFKNDNAFMSDYTERGRKFLSKFHSQEAAASKFIKLCEQSIREFEPIKTSASISLCMIMCQE